LLVQPSRRHPHRHLLLAGTKRFEVFLQSGVRLFLGAARLILL
jgi:hypothetical protein